MQMKVGDRLQCDHCPDEVYTETAENGQTLQRTRPTTHPIQGFVPAKTIEQPTHVGTSPDGAPVIEPRTMTFADSRPILHCPTLYADQIHESPRMRLHGTAERT